MVALHDAALNQVWISKQPKISQYCVQNPIKIYKQLSGFDDLKHTGCPGKLSDLEIRHLKRLIKGNFLLSASKVTTGLSASLLEPGTIRAIQRHSKDLAFEYPVKIKT